MWFPCSLLAARRKREHLQSLCAQHTTGTAWLQPPRQQTQGSVCTEHVGETKPLKLSVQRTILVTLQLELNVICCVGINPRSPLQASLCKHSTIFWHQVVDSYYDSSLCSCQPSLKIGSTALFQVS